jgi:tumor protein p53-inducible protein 3
LIWNAQLKDGSTVLIHAGASGVGLAAIQLAKTLRENVNVIATTRSSEKVPICIENGADLVILTAEKNFSEEVMKFTNGRGADVILDFVGGSYWEKNINCLASDSHLILLAMLGGSMTQSNVDLGQMLRKRLTIKGSTLRSRSIEYKGKLISEFSNEVIPLFISKRCWPAIDSYFTIDEVSKAHERMKQNINKGKIVLTVQSVLL